MQSNSKQGLELEVKLAKPALRALNNLGITTLEQVSKFSENEIKNLHGIGPNALEQLRKALELKGWTFSKK
ncbi:hypothetical protein SAMN04488542_11768 [Fontibacillus panacisegetis]|uniref:RNA polymerase, alpha chain C terminal domain n=1 Tax=Fontibacillus panacisegetis TaxID=670482 RepID=A0A1G7P090_9BACL|nr:hypothetical protein [Fontibacillus panacisegetis]SDF79726.1 hypothetical protein SAMN04488542_11768 [Fontibacillus panacisegetis]